MRTQAHNSSGPLREGTKSPGSGSFLPDGMLVTEVCLGANSAQWGPQPSPKHQDCSGRISKHGEDLAFVCVLIRTFRSFLALQSHPLLNLNPTQAPTPLPAGRRAVGGSRSARPASPACPRSSCN